MKITSRACALMVFGLASSLAWGADHAAPASESPAPNVGELEKAFWACDYIATTRGVLAAPVVTCRYVTDELQKEKFGGDYDRMLAWWRQNKVAEHRKLAQSIRG